MTKLNFDDGEAYTFLDELVRKKLDERFYTVKMNLDLRKESKTTKRNDTQTFISFKCPECKKKWKSGYGHVEVYYKFNNSENSVSFNTKRSNQQCRDCEVDALSFATEKDLEDVAARLCANVETSLGFRVYDPPAEFVLKWRFWLTRHFSDCCDACKRGVCYHE